MNENYDLYKEARQSKLVTAPTVSDDDIINVWKYVSEYISKQIRQKKGVHINGFGTFTYSLKRSESKQKKSTDVYRPVFILSEKFALNHGIENNKKYITNDVHVSPLNYSAIAFESPYHRDKIEGCVRDVLLTMSRGVASGRNIEFVFDGLGRLSFRQKKVKMKFFKEFVNTLEESPQIFKAMSNRPFTADSVMTDRPLSRPFTSNTILLPRADADGRLPAIPEDDALLTNRETTAEKSELEKTSSHSEVKQNEVIETTAPVKELQ